MNIYIYKYIHRSYFITGRFVQFISAIDSDRQFGLEFVTILNKTIVEKKSG